MNGDLTFRKLRLEYLKSLLKLSSHSACNEEHFAQWRSQPDDLVRYANIFVCIGMG